MNGMRYGFLLFIFPSSTSASEFLDAGISNPSMVNVFAKNSWSQSGYWDLTGLEDIPDTVTVESAAVFWSICTSCGMNYMYTNVALLNQDGYGDFMSSGFQNSNFKYQPVKQVWSVQYYVTNNLTGGRGYITPRLVVFWKDSNSLTAGKVEINEVKLGHNLLEKEDLFDED